MEEKTIEDSKTIPTLSTARPFTKINTDEPIDLKLASTLHSTNFTNAPFLSSGSINIQNDFTNQLTNTKS